MTTPKFRHVLYMTVIVVTLTLVMPASAQTTDAEIIHLLNRITFGPTEADLEKVRGMGMETYLEQQLHPDRLPQNSELNARLNEIPELNSSLIALATEYGMPEGAKKMAPEDRKDIQKEERELVRDLSEAKILRAIMSPAQLQEVMVDFWFNHFNVFAEKGPDKVYVGPYERDAIRPYVLGKFRDLLGATAHHPAMLFYLDNWLNTDPNSRAARNRKIGINENYAREIMELHTLGVNGGYTQEDVTTLAHILTGWGLSKGPALADRSSFMFDPTRHDFTNKNWLDVSIRGSGQQEVEQILDILARHPSTAKHIAFQLAQYFVADDPPEHLVEELAKTFEASDGDIATVLYALFHSREFWDAKNIQNKFKPPLRYVVSAFRALDAVPQGDTSMLQNAIAQMGEPLYRCQTPNGYANTNDQWLNSDSLLKRIDFSKQLAHFVSDSTANRLEHIYGSLWSASTRATVEKAEPHMKPILLLSSPEFVYY